MSPCPGREGAYVPWSWGEAFTCLACGAAVQQSHLVQPLRGKDREAVFPIPAHEVKS